MTLPPTSSMFIRLPLLSLPRDCLPSDLVLKFLYTPFCVTIQATCSAHHFFFTSNYAYQPNICCLRSLKQQQLIVNFNWLRNWETSCWNRFLYEWFVHGIMDRMLGALNFAVSKFLWYYISLYGRYHIQLYSQRHWVTSYPLILHTRFQININQLKRLFVRFFSV